jgi:hypothetical protein
MTTVGRLLTRKQELAARLRGKPGPHERSEIESLIAKIDTALDLLVRPNADTEVISVSLVSADK